MMKKTNLNYKKLISIVVVILFITILLLVSIDKLLFRQTSSDPTLTKIPTSVSNLYISFSQPLKTVDSITINNIAIDNYLVDETNLKIPLNNIDISEGKEYTLVMKNIKSKWFNNIIKESRQGLTFTYIEFNKLSDKQQKDQVDQSNSGQIDDPFLNNQFPILDENLNWQIEANNSAGVINVEVTFLEEVPDYDNGGRVNQLPNDVAERYRKEALDVIKKYEGTPEKYEILYSNNYLNTKYSHSYHD